MLAFYPFQLKALLGNFSQVVRSSREQARAC